jgi:hypothetical protein
MFWGKFPDATSSTGPNVNGFHVFAPRELPDPADDFLAVEEKLVPHHGVTRKDGEAVTLDHAGMGIGGIGCTHQRWPVIANRVLGRLAADLMFLEELFDNV